jgi:tripartite ATP-independent transporter DctM subunit
MEWYWALLILIGSALGFMFVGVPVALAFLGANIIGSLLFFGGEAGLAQAVRNTVEGLTTFALAPVVMFILMGEILFRSGVAVRAIDAVDRLMLNIPGRLALVVVGGGSVFATLTGSSMASTAVLSSTVLPEMRRRGYHTSMSMGPIMGTGGIAMLIPPSGMAVLLGSLSGISISGILVSAAIPGVLIALCYTCYILLRCGLNPKLAPRYDVPKMALRERVIPFLVNVVPLFSLCMLVIGSILLGWATPTESASVGAMGAVVICLCYRSLNWPVLRDALIGTGRVAVPILLIAGMSLTFSQILSFSGATQGIVQLVKTLDPEPFYLLVLMLGIVLFLGCLMDPYSILLITLPFYMPLATLAGFDLIWFGVLMLLSLEIGQVTPPFGMILFVMKGIAAEARMQTIYFAVVPFILMELGVLIFLVLVPGTVTWLPALIR